MRIKNPLKRMAICCVGTILAIVVACACRTVFAEEFVHPLRSDGAVRMQWPADSVQQAAHVEAEPARLTPPTVEQSTPISSRPRSENTRTSASSPGGALTVLGSLAVVLGLFLLLAWLLRRGLPAGSRMLPSEVAEVLGRTPLSGRQQMHMIRFGNKLLLVCESTTGAATLGEISDRAQIDRLLALCRAPRRDSKSQQAEDSLDDDRGGRKSDGDADWPATAGRTRAARVAEAMDA